ncbi:hypothetical protein D3C83_18370 [compost metagenome]
MRADDDFRIPDRHERESAARIRTITKTEPLGQAERMPIHLPAGRAVRIGGLAEYFEERFARALHLASRPLFVCIFDAVAPAHSVERVDRGFEAGMAHSA